MSAAEPTEAERWLGYALGDLTAAEGMVGGESFGPRHICWMSQQAAEKALKAVLVFAEVKFPRSHDLEQLRGLVPFDWRFRDSLPDLSELTQWSMEARYPGDWNEASPAQAAVALEQAHIIVLGVRADLRARGLPEA